MKGERLGDEDLSKQKLRHVFVLGAGFSRAVSGSMPLLTELSKEVMNAYVGRGSIPTEIQSMISSNFEEAMSYLAQFKPWLRESELLRQRALFLELGQVLSAVLNHAEADAMFNMSTEPPTWLVELIKYWHRERATVVTLNYDTLVESVASEIAVPGEDRTSFITIQSLYPPVLTDAASRTSLIMRNPPLDTFELLKLHGSTNWFYSGQESARGEIIYSVDPVGPHGVWAKRISEATQVGRENVRDKYPFIVPPVFDKASLLTHESIRSVWFKAGDALSRADRVTFVGYSLPSSDRTMKHFLASMISPKATLELVDLSNKCEHYCELFPMLKTSISQKFEGEGCLEKYVRSIVRFS